MAEASFGYFDSNLKATMPAQSSCDEFMASFLWAYSVSLTKVPQELAMLDTGEDCVETL